MEVKLTLKIREVSSIFLNGRAPSPEKEGSVKVDSNGATLHIYSFTNVLCGIPVIFLFGTEFILTYWFHLKGSSEPQY